MNYNSAYRERVGGRDWACCGEGTGQAREKFNLVRILNRADKKPGKIEGGTFRRPRSPRLDVAEQSSVTAARYLLPKVLYVLLAPPFLSLSRDVRGPRLECKVCSSGWVRIAYFCKASTLHWPCNLACFEKGGKKKHATPTCPRTLPVRCIRL